MIKNRYSQVMSDLQNIQDLLAEKLMLFIVLIDEQQNEMTLPSRLPLVCYENAPDRQCQNCLSHCIQLKKQEKDPTIIHKCHRGLFISITQTNIIYEVPVYLISGRTPNLNDLEKELALLKVIYTLPIDLKTTKAIDKPPAFSVSPKFQTLTQQELKILFCLGTGLANKDIADKLGITLSTVKTHIVHILKKLAVKNRTEASILAVQEGLINDEKPFLFRI